MLKVLVADIFPEEKQEELKSLGMEVKYQPKCSPDELGDVLKGMNILCVRSTKVTAEALQDARDLMLIIRVGSGVNTIDVKAASEMGIYVANCPGKNAIAVAELAAGLIVSADRRIPQATASLRSGKWEKKKYAQADGLKGKSVGIVGIGRIGREVLKRLRGFDLEAYVFSEDFTKKDAKELGVIYCETLQELVKQVDIVTTHVPYLESTHHLFNKDIFSLMKENTIFVNTSRGKIHDQEALLEAMNTKGIRAALDVFDQEPSSSTADFSAEIVDHPNFIGTPHIGASTRQAQLAVADEALRIIRTFMSKGTVPNCVNLVVNTKACCQMIIRHYNKVGVLAAVMDLLKEEDINIETMSNTIFQSGLAAVASMRLDQIPPQSVIDRLEKRDDLILQVTVNPL